MALAPELLPLPSAGISGLFLPFLLQLQQLQLGEKMCLKTIFKNTRRASLPDAQWQLILQVEEKASKTDLPTSVTQRGRMDGAAYTDIEGCKECLKIVSQRKR